MRVRVRLGAGSVAIRVGVRVRLGAGSGAIRVRVRVRLGAGSGAIRVRVRVRLGAGSGVIPKHECSIGISSAFRQHGCHWQYSECTLQLRDCMSATIVPPT